MKRRVNKKKSNILRNASLFLLLLFSLFVITVIPSLQANRFIFAQGKNTAPISFTPVPAKPNLQLEWFLVPTYSPSAFPAQTVVSSPPPKPQTVVNPPVSTPNSATCASYDDSGIIAPSSCICVALAVECSNGKPTFYNRNGPIKWNTNYNPCNTFVAPTDGRYCIAKPVIYLYPTMPTRVSVQVTTTGQVVVSNPLYPKGGWKNVLASPDGTLQYQGKLYSELFYETSVTSFQQPTTGKTLKSSQLQQELAGIVDKLGLINSEKQEFLAFWVPRLEATHAPYIYFSLLNTSTKAQVDHVSISPKPDTQISFIAYFKPITKPRPNTLVLPPTPQRKGFVSVEWGGVMDK